LWSSRAIGAGPTARLRRAARPRAARPRAAGTRRTRAGAVRAQRGQSREV